MSCLTVCISSLENVTIRAFERIEMKAHPLDLHALMPRGVWKFILTSGSMKMLMTKKQKKKVFFFW